MFPTGAAAAKRRKIESYPKGSVIRVEVKNFMTYAHAVIEPGPRLNLVLGPNGTGKSSLVCALCVGLAGSTRLLGRGEHVSEFVRRGTPSGEVTVTLASGDPARPHTVRRTITRADNSSTWALNGREAAMKDVLELVRSLNIQLDNLCQFLPQDKVVEFARLRPEELLRATEEAVGDSRLKAAHEELVALRAAAAHQAAHEGQIQAALETLRGDHARAERSVAQIRERERLEAEAAALRAKVPWAEYDEAKKAFEGEKGQLTAAQASLRTMKERAAVGDAPVAAKKREAERAAAAEKRAREAEKRADWARPAGCGAAARDPRLTLEDLVARIEAKQAELEGLEKKSAARQRKIAAAQAAIVQGEADMAAAEAAAAPDPAAERRRGEIDRQIKDLSTQEVSITSEMEALREEEEEARREGARRGRRLAALSDAREQRLRALDDRFRGIAAVAAWVRANRARFRGPVFGPVGAEIECPDPAHAAMLEAQISGAWMSQFVVLHREDQDLLKAEVPRACGGFRPHVAFYAGDADAPLAHDLGRASQYARFGVVNTLDEVFQAPAAVKKALDNNFFIAKVFTARADADTAGFFAAQPRAEILFTPDAKISHRVSRYNRDAVSTVVAALRPARTLAAGGGAAAGGGERAELEAAVAAARAGEAAAKAAREAKEPELAEVKRRKRALADERGAADGARAAALKRKSDVVARLRSKRAELARLEREREPLEGRPALEAEVAAALAAAAEAAVGLADAYAEWAGAAAAVAAPALAARQLGDQAERLAAAARDRAAEAQRMEALVMQYEREVRALKNAMDAAHAAAREATGWPIPEDLAAAFQGMPSGAAELRAAAAAKADEAEGLLINDPNALARHQQRAAEIAENERQLAAAVAARDTVAAEIASKKERWVGELRRICAVVNANFSAAFPSVGVAGEVGLREAPDDDFARYAIEIRVKFRDAEALATLDASRQSGGERSVSTILYLVALQEVAAAPFRVVDEINQGMDPANERKVFRLLVDAATAPDTPQCFLLTPKLLPDLPFSREVTVLQIMNGTTIREVAQGFCRERIAGGRGAAAAAVAARG